MGVPTILIAGVGNIFLGDDAFGVEVVRRLAGHAMPEGVTVRDYGIRGLDLAYALLNNEDAFTILVDAAPQGGMPGTLYTIQPDLPDETSREQAMLETHSMDPLRVLRIVRSMGGNLKHVLVVGCEPLTLGPQEGLMGLSAPVEAAVGEAVKLVESLVAAILAGEPVARPN